MKTVELFAYWRIRGVNVNFTRGNVYVYIISTLIKCNYSINIGQWRNQEHFMGGEVLQNVNDLWKSITS